MKVKSSNSYTRVFLLGVFCLVAVLFVFNPSKGKPSKYPEDIVDFKRNTDLEGLQLTFSEKAFKKIANKRLKALSKGVLETSTEDYVPATVSFKGRDFKAEARLKGDWTDHLKGDKWSFRVKLKGDETILGMRKFSIHHPQTRGFFYTAEWLYLKAIKREGVMGLRYHYVEGSIHTKNRNGTNNINKNVGIYALEETFDKRTIESNRAKESVILKFAEDNFWNEVRKSIEVGASLGYKWGEFMNYGLVAKTKYQILPFSEEKVVADSTMYSYFKLSRTLLNEVYQNKRPIHTAFDVKKLAIQNAILNLFGAVHGTYIINLRFYYNPITSKLEPIAFDGNSGLKLKKYEHFLFLDKEKDTVYLKELAYALDKVSRPEYLQLLISDYKEEMAVFDKPLKKEFVSKGFSQANLELNQNILKAELIRLKNKFKLDDIIIDTESVAEKVTMPDVSYWINNKVTLSKTSETFQNDIIYKMARNNTITPSYSVILNTKVNRGKRYKTNILVKRSGNSSYFGLRVQGEYPNRLDAVFDLEKGMVKEASVSGDFEEVKAKVTPVGEGWFNCELSGNIKANTIKIILGPTSKDRSSKSWEGIVEGSSETLVIPTSLIIEEVSNNPN